MYLAKLEGHKKTVIDVRIFEHLNLVISISKDEVIDIIKLILLFKTFIICIRY
jgi:hypothetical protein